MADLSCLKIDRTENGIQTSHHLQEPAAQALSLVVARCAAVMRGGVGLAAAIAAILTPPPDHRFGWLGIGASAAWCVTFVVTTLRSGFTDSVIAGDLAITVVLCLLQGRLLPADEGFTGVTWVAGLVSITLVVLNLAWPPRRAVFAGLLLTGAHLAGARAAGVEDGGWFTALIQILQVLALALLMLLLRRTTSQTDAVMRQVRAETSEAAAVQAQREDENRENDRLHGTVLATLTVVATGGVQRTTPRLRQDATDALAVLDRFRARPDGPAMSRATVQLRGRLQALADRADVSVHTELQPVVVSEAVAGEVQTAVREALANVALHAQTTEAVLRLAGIDQQFEVEIIDAGVGFDIEAIPEQRYGLRRAIVEAIRRVGGDVEIESRPGMGTRIVLRFSR